MKKFGFNSLMLLLALMLLIPVISVAQNGTRHLQVDASRTVAPIQPTMYGIFFEDINFAADGGLYAELVKNRGFEFPLPKMGWEQPHSDRHSMNKNSGMGTIIQNDEFAYNRNYLHIEINDPAGYQLINEGFRGMGIKVGERYDLSVNLANKSDLLKAVVFQLIDTAGAVIGQTTINPGAGDAWTTCTGVIMAKRTCMHARLLITFEGTGSIDMDMVSLFPQDTWKGRKGGLRKDIVQLLYDMHPGFLRFPGGCIVEGRTLDRRYQWKKTVGPADEREVLVNRWNTEFAHRLTPDYYQSFGIGFYEYFLLSEDLGATPLPIVNCGMACQFNSCELVPMDELGPYVQDALDLIEFANGSTDTQWGALRADMGHPESFNLKYIGIGNEQWGPAYFERYLVFEKAIREKYPDVVIVSGSGPFPDGEFFEYGWDELIDVKAEIVDEHYYRPPSWFRENATRYDSYDRNGPKVFAGEYAAQSVAIASPDNRNNWDCALSEAAFMTGLERNAQVVVMTSYAPLMAHAEAWQWTPDMIWFNNLQAYGTANYYVQKLYANNKGTDLLTITEGKEPLVGQGGLYASAVRDDNTNELIIKVVNTSDQAQSVAVKIKKATTADEALVLTLHGAAPDEVNSFGSPEAISPKESKVSIQHNTLEAVVPAATFQVFKVKL